jgi:molybdopterin converting factor small subunit
MNIHLDFKGIPILYKTFNKKKEMNFDFPGKTLGELIKSLLKRYGLSIRKALLNNNGDIDMEIRVVLNDTTYLTGDRMATPLNDGDTLSFRGAS